jgi:hypothetical protein
MFSLVRTAAVPARNVIHAKDVAATESDQVVALPMTYLKNTCMQIAAKLTATNTVLKLSMNFSAQSSTFFIQVTSLDFAN